MKIDKQKVAWFTEEEYIRYLVSDSIRKLRLEADKNIPEPVLSWKFSNFIRIMYGLQRQGRTVEIKTDVTNSIKRTFGFKI